ncbi:hypothetical protein U875_13985 [Pandoraea pnomenusa 3kgm]|uniref:DUF4376 domain-containing protein n=1 Tax=Pandoraea pnomenusa TaxID=93220 RepID=UPI0003C775C3|nr:DUF4376 domain-containing protein [Pandoraea pnomenusa]AHB08501.1 hypothetical protein U875_13985 [Pandoraea pnomenusa 3kgm]
MPYFQDKAGKLYFLSDEDVATGGKALLPDGCKAITDDQALAIENPPLGLDAARANQMAILYSAYQAASQVDVAYKTVAGVQQTFQADASSQSTLLIATTGYNLAGQTPAGFYWVASDNAQVPFSVEDLKGLYAVMLAQGNVAFNKLQTLKAAVRSAATVAEVLAVTWG